MFFNTAMLLFSDTIDSSGIVNRLIVKQENYREDFDKSCYYVIIGNRRLCALRSLNYSGLVPCIIALEADAWDDYTQALYVFEQTIVEGID